MRKYTFIILAVLTTLFSACNDDDSFTTSPSNTLTFSSDTIDFDTIFSRTASTTKTFWVHNNSGDGIRCASVRLKNGNQTGFRVNVDGIYLGSSQGYQTSEIEVRDKDSIRVFVEITAPYNNSTSPQLVQDDLVFTLESGVEQNVNLRAYSWDAEVHGLWEIQSDTTISQGDKPIIIQQGLSVDSGATLTITEGTTLYFSQKAGVDVYGTLKTEGTAEENVVFRGDRLDNMFDYLPYDRVPGQWQGVRFYESSYNNSLDFTDIHSAYDGVVCDSSDINTLKLQAWNTTIHNCQGAGILSTNSKIELWNCQITNTLNDCATFYGGDVSILHCTLAQFYPFDANRGAALHFANNLAGTEYPLVKFDVENTLITGYADDVLLGELDNNADSAYMFSHCIIRTPEPDDIDTTKFQSVIFEEVSDTSKVQGEKHFVNIDADNQYYDFHLDSASTAIDAGAVLTSPYSLTDHDGLARDELPDIGAYEYHPSTDSNSANAVRRKAYRRRHGN